MMRYVAKPVRSPGQDYDSFDYCAIFDEDNAIVRLERVDAWDNADLIYEDYSYIAPISGRFDIRNEGRLSDVMIYTVRPKNDYDVPSDETLVRIAGRIWRALCFWPTDWPDDDVSPIPLPQPRAIELKWRDGTPVPRPTSDGA